MKLKTRIILNRVIIFVLGVLFICVGLLQNIESFVPMGTAMVICTALQLARQWKFLFSPEKMKELENTYNDERLLFIAQKSYSFAFWVSVFAEFVSIIVTMYLRLENISSVLSMVVCFKILIYAVANLFYSRKY